MKTKVFKVIIASGKGHGLTTKIVPGTLISVGAEYATFVHRDPLYFISVIKDGRYENNEAYSGWHVSELSTGAVVAKGRTRKDAILNAISKVKQVRPEGMKIAVERSRAFLKENGIKI